RHYRCQNCERIWLYVEEWHLPDGDVADWYPQGANVQALFDERMRTKVYR
ncbi:hypothetical protein LCGC14_2983650, partial [marine sediment metagenome]